MDADAVYIGVWSKWKPSTQSTSVLFAENKNYGDRKMMIEDSNNKKRSHTQLDSRKQVIAFQDRVMTIKIKEAQHPPK